MTHGQGKSDRPVVPTKPPNNAEPSVAEVVEGRGLAKGNTGQQNASRTQSRTSAPSALDRVRQAARKDGKAKFTALFHHVTIDQLGAAFHALERRAAPGVDGVTWEQYEQQLEDNLRDLHARLHRGGYRAKPSRRVFIPKADGRQRPLGVAALEDKIVQRAVVEVLNAIYETSFLGFSYGFRLGRNQHQALDALAVGIRRGKENGRHPVRPVAGRDDVRPQPRSPGREPDRATVGRGPRAPENRGVLGRVNGPLATRAGFAALDPPCALPGEGYYAGRQQPPEDKKRDDSPVACPFLPSKNGHLRWASFGGHAPLDGRLDDGHRFLLGIQLERLTQVEQSLAKLDARIDQKLEPYRDQHRRLMQIPGVDRVSAASIIAELGVDMSVFPTVAQAAAWAGVCPGNHESARKHKGGKHRRGNPHLTTTLVQAAVARPRRRAATSKRNTGDSKPAAVQSARHSLSATGS